MFTNADSCKKFNPQDESILSTEISVGFIMIFLHQVLFCRSPKFHANINLLLSDIKVDLRSKFPILVDGRFKIPGEGTLDFPLYRDVHSKK